jgi:hypothetical protein
MAKTPFSLDVIETKASFWKVLCAFCDNIVQSSFRRALRFKLVILTISSALLGSPSEGRPIDPQLFPTALAMILMR